MTREEYTERRIAALEAKVDELMKVLSSGALDARIVTAVKESQRRRVL